MKNSFVGFLLLGLGIFVLIFAISVHVGRFARSMAANSDFSSSRISSTPTNYCDEMKAWNDSRPPQSKLEMSEEAYQKCVTALTQVPKTRVYKPEETHIPTSVPKETRLRRIAGNGILIEGFMGMRDPRVFVQTNTWYEKSGDRFVYVYGGIKRDASPDRSHSAVAVVVSDLAGNWLSEGGIYEAPVQAGELTILDAKGEILILSTPGGDNLFFDVPSRKFISPDADTLASSKQRKAGDGMVIEKRGSPFDSSYIVTNRLVLEKNGKRTSVFCGRTKSNNGQAVVVVTTSKSEPTISDPIETYSVPDFVASEWEFLRIFDVHQEKVILVGKRGGAYLFDLSTKKFLSRTEAAQLPDDPALLALEATYEKMRSEAAASVPGTVTPLTPEPADYP